MHKTTKRKSKRACGQTDEQRQARRSAAAIRRAEIRAASNFARRLFGASVVYLVERGYTRAAAFEACWRLTADVIKTHRGPRWRQEQKAIVRKFGRNWDKPGYTYTPRFRRMLPIGGFAPLDPVGLEFPVYAIIDTGKKQPSSC